MLSLIIIVVGILSFMLLEQIIPDQKLKYVKGWWKYVVISNSYQLGLVIIGMYTWEKWFNIPSILNLGNYLSPFMGGLVAYLINTWIFYWWHRARHEIYILWIFCHQMHHSPQRIEVATSFYKHPFEMLADSLLMTILMYPILGLRPESSIWLTMFSAFSEYFYHMNIRTPHWVGYFFQRPEAHRLHHGRNKRLGCPNNADLPIWDILGGTYKNPREVNQLVFIIILKKREKKF